MQSCNNWSSFYPSSPSDPAGIRELSDGLIGGRGSPSTKFVAVAESAMAQKSADAR